MICTSAASYIAAASQTAGSASELAAVRKKDKYACLAYTHIFEPTAFETLGPMNSTAVTLLCDLGRKTTARTDKTRETSFLFNVVHSIFNVLYLSQSPNLSFPPTIMISDHFSIVFNFSFSPRKSRYREH